MWLTSWRSFCPVCKRDAGAGVSGPPASETTPLFSSAVHLPSPSSSFRSSVGASPPRPISRCPSSQSISHIYSLSGTPHSPSTQRYYRNSSAMSISRSSADLANMSSYLGSTHSPVGNHLSSPININYTPSRMYHPGIASPSPHVSSSYMSNSGYGSSGHYLGSSSQHRSYLRHCGESGPSLSTMAPQSPQQQSQLRHSGESETNLNLAGTSSGQSFRQSYLRHCGDSGASLSAMASSGQSLPGG
jgi:E3 ubiquitin-protein ligase RNF13